MADLKTLIETLRTAREDYTILSGKSDGQDAERCRLQGLHCEALVAALESEEVTASDWQELLDALPKLKRFAIGDHDVRLSEPEYNTILAALAEMKPAD
jgi:hypothetical protein